MSFLSENIDKEKIIESIEQLNLTTEQRLDVKAIVWTLGEYYAERDFYECKIIDCEHKFKHGNDIAGTIDLILEVKNPKYLPKDSINKKLLVDWKTTNVSTFDSKFRKRYINSWQWKIYCAYGLGNYFEYRCISKETGESTEILLKNNVEIEASVYEYIDRLNLIKEALNETVGLWPRHMPYACNAYARKCSFLDICENNQFIEGTFREPFHYTTIETFLLCPERYRLTEVIKLIDNNKEEDSSFSNSETPETLLGAAVHKGMESIYSQLKDIQKQKGMWE